MILLIIFIIPQTVPFVNMEYYTRNPCVFRKSWRFFGGIYGSATDSKKSTVHYTEYRRSLLFRILSFRKKRLQFNYNSQKAIVFLAVIVYNDRRRNQSAGTAWTVLCEMRCIFDEEDYIYTIQTAAIWTVMAIILYVLNKMHMDNSLFLTTTLRSF